MAPIWLILITLTLARTTMGFQFQSVAALGPLLTANAFITHAQLGALIGIYLLPGVLFAIPGGWLGKRFGDKRVVLVGLVMMTFGGLSLASAHTYEVMLPGRLVSGLGAVLLNVLISKMVTDWFAEYKITTAMGVMISSWPLGIAIALLTMGPLEQIFGLQWAFMVPVALCAIALLLVLCVYTNPPKISEIATGEKKTPTTKLSSLELRGVILSGCVWCFYNVAFILPLSFGPDFLVMKGESLTSAGAIVSLASWLIIPALPLGAMLAEKIGHPVSTMVVTLTAITLLVWIIPVAPFYIVIFALLGVVFGPAGGLIMALPSQILRVENRAMGMGIFFTIYYAGMGIVPGVAGYALDVTGNAAAPFILAGLAALLAVLAYLGFRRIQIKQAINAAAA